MKRDEAHRIVLLVIIAGRKQKDALLSELHETGAKLTNTVYGQGTANASYLTDVLGLVPEDNKVVIMSMLKSGDADDALKMLVKRFHFDRPNTGIAFTVPLDRLSF